MKGRHILLVEDDASLAFVIRDNLELNDYRITHKPNGKAALEAFIDSEFDLCLMDVMMPEMDGFECAKKIREVDKNIPILFLTARSMEEDLQKGFETGGDDYIVKPFNFKELLLRIEVFLRRSSTNLTNDAVFKITSHTSFDYANLNLTVLNSSIKLTSKEGELLNFLCNNKNQLVKRDDILMAVWGDDDYFMGRSLDVFISRLRKYLADDNAVELRNHHGVGFVLMVN